MIHLYCSINDIKDTSINYIYHNKKFKYESEKRGLIFNQSEPCKSNGWYDTLLSEEGEKVVDGFNLNLNVFSISRDVVEEIEAQGDIQENVRVASKSKRNSKYICFGCDMEFKAKKELNLICGECGVMLEERE
ncbi:hypothetical protein AB1L07_02210 [Niallia alba]|uniref:hypothetical protein n=1 Tax=Niallia alba TaxID=2729105 RepID=UPI0039A0A98D